MNNQQIAVRFDPHIAEKIHAAAAAKGMTAPAVVQACVEFYLPVIEAGLHGLPKAKPMLDQWRADLKDATDYLDNLPHPARTTKRRAV